MAVSALALASPAAAHHGSGDRHDGFGHDPAGTIASFNSDSGVLVIDLADGGSVSGIVTRWTRIEDGDDRCETSRRALHGWCRHKLHGSDPGEDHGRHHGWEGDTEDLLPGTTVEDALIVLREGRAFFWKVELDD